MPSRRRHEPADFRATSEGFIGRDLELDRIRALLSGSARLITLTGMGGIGKTRLAVEAVGQFRKAARMQVHCVRLARLARGSTVTAVEEEIAHAALAADFSGRSAWKALVDQFTANNVSGRTPQTLLVLDNCEHVLAEARSIIAELLDAAPDLVILATSREPVGWVDEHLVAVPPLSGQQALSLFRQRAELTGFAVTDTADVAIARQICWHMHHHPLYIRLAAARLRRQPLPTILQELTGGANDQRMQWSPAWQVGVDARHQRVPDVIAWSYELCTDQERLLLARLSVFAAGHDTDPEEDHNPGHEVGAELEALESVCADDQFGTGDGRQPVRLAKDEIEGLLERLVDQSLASQHRTGTTVRYSLLETIRVFAHQRLQECSADEPARVARRHRQYYRDKILQAYAGWFGPAELDYLYWARASWANIQLAIESSLHAPGESATGLEISVGLIALRAPFFNASLRETRQWTERALAASRSLTPQPTELQVIAMALIGWIALWQGQYADTERMLDECVALCIPDPADRQDWRQHPEIDLGLPPAVEFTWGQELMLVHGSAESMTVLARAQEKNRAAGDHSGLAMGTPLEAMAVGFFGATEYALDTVRSGVDRADAAGARWLTSWTQLMWALVLTENGDPAEALSVGRRSLAHLVSIPDQWGSGWAVYVRSWALAQIISDATAAGGADPDELVALATEAARLMGGAETLCKDLGTDIEKMVPLAQKTNWAIEVARGVLGPEAYAVAEREGAQLRPNLYEVQRLALGQLPMDRVPAGGVRTGTASLWDELTRAEREVAKFAAQGWTNTAIAARRGSSTRTVDAQMTAIFQKLMITSRNDIIRFVPKT
ncbi:LuxR family transcriptional regulator [Nocardia uniformis]|uniref:LuxR family transcriptional regulator n=1 Tax=Nocardia uniformis TaxID=53432 RepID=A0A849C635_9NOCA|nr:AAA family ATPase [Nocardia uniformis]NNH73238.1 LuxR family transcriptional regulator [Nocardia uniformis]